MNTRPGIRFQAEMSKNQPLCAVLNDGFVGKMMAIVISTSRIAHTILVVEDNNAVRELAVHALNLHGYRVLEANNAASGLAMFRQHPEIDLIFTDIIMPGGMSGIEMAKQILAEQPDALILLATGYQEKGNALKEHAARSENIAAVSKPYDVNELPKLIAAMLANSSKQVRDKSA